MAQPSRSPAPRPGPRGVRPTGPPQPRVPMLLMRVWDLPTRLFTGGTVLLVALAYLSVQRGWTQVHFLSGYATLALLLFRLAWGFVGSETSRFRRIARNPADSLRRLATREPDAEVGHSAAGGWMALALLLTLLAHVASGLFSTGGGVAGPLAHWVSQGASDWITGLHGASFIVLLVLAVLYAAAAIVYAVVKRHDLVQAVATGKKRLPATLRQPRFASPLLAAGILAVAAAAVWMLVWLA